MKSFYYRILLAWFSRVAMVALATLAGCVQPGSIKPDVTTAQQLQAALGKPTDVRPRAAGGVDGEAWDYVYGPQGVQTWRYTLDRMHVVRKVEQLLTEERLYKVMAGVSTEADVLELLGRPARINNLTHENVWEWRVDLRPTPGYFIVNFSFDGIARGTGILMDMTADDHG